MFKSRMDNKGQISAEYLLLMVVILIILSAVTIPLVGKSVDASNDVSGTSDAKIAVESIANAANVVYANGPGAKRKFKFYAPVDMRIVLGPTGVSTNVTLSDGSIKTVSAKTECSMYDGNFAVSKGWNTVIIIWYQGHNRISNWVGL